MRGKFYAMECLKCGRRFMASSVKYAKCPSCGEGNNLQVLYESPAGIDVLRFLERA